MELKELGLTDNEAKTYEVLIRLGKTTASNLSKESQVPYGRIYNVLASLEEKGLVRVLPEETKKFIPSTPEKFEEIIKNKIHNLKKIKKHVEKLKFAYEKEITEPVLIAKGKSNFTKLLDELKKPKSTDYSIKYNFDTNPKLMRNIKEQISKGVDVKVIGRIDQENKKNIKKWTNIYTEIKPINNKGIAMSINDKEEVLISLIKSNTTLIIRDKAFAEVMNELFLKYYNNE